jgi:pentapeptide repeat protein
MKRWTAMPRGLHWLVAGIAVVVLVVVVASVLFVPVADWLATHDVGSVTGPVRALRLQTARDAARGRLLTLGAGVLAAGALIFTASNYRLARRTHELTEQGQVTDRYTKAIEQLGSEKLDVRIGGIYALERIARDSPRDHPTVIEVLSAFVREHSREDSGTGPSARSKRPDVQAAVTVIGRRNTGHDRQRVDLSYADLTGANLMDANLARTSFLSAILSQALLSRADLKNSYLGAAKLVSAAFCVSLSLIGRSSESARGAVGLAAMSCATRAPAPASSTAVAPDASAAAAQYRGRLLCQ